MYLVNVYLKSRPSPIQFMFTSFESASAAGKDMSQIVDDYGQTGIFNPDDISAYLIMDFFKVTLGETDKQMITAKARVFAEERWSTDPVIALIMQAGQLSRSRVAGNS